MLDALVAPVPDFTRCDVHVPAIRNKAIAVIGMRRSGTERVELFLSGSSARLLSREVATSMRGRAMEALVHPFRFREFLRHHGREPSIAANQLPKAARSAIDRDLITYLQDGGFPESLGAAPRDRTELLRGYVDTTLLRDVIERHAVSHPLALRWMVRQLLANAAGAFSVNRFHADLRSQNVAIAKDTLHAYLAHLEDAFLVRTVSLFSGSERRRMIHPRKAYPVDMGLIPLFDQTGRANLGHALETAVLLELERRGAQVSYVRTGEGHEVDFFARHADGSRELIQVCARLDSDETRTREIRALVEAGKEFRGARRTLTSLDPQVPVDLPQGVEWQAASAWLLE